MCQSLTTTKKQYLPIFFCYPKFNLIPSCQNFFDNMKSESLEKWKKYFESADCSIYDIIYNAIMVAAMDDPKKFRSQRDKISEQVYNAVQVCESCCSFVVDHSECANAVLGFDQTSNYTLQETKELGDKIEDEHENIRHILEIKEQLNNDENETETVSSLQMLSLIVQSVEDLKATHIGKTVSDLQHHWSRKVAEAAKRTTDKFKKMIKDRTCDNAALSERSKATDPPSILDENVLPSPPIDEGIPMFGIAPGELSTFFEDLDDDGNPKISNEIEKLHESQTEKKTKMSEGTASIHRDNLRKEKQQLTTKLTDPKHSRPSHNVSEIGMIHGGHRNPPTENKREVELRPGEELEPFPQAKRQKPSRKESNEKLTNQTNSRPSDTEHSSRRLRTQRVQIDGNNDIKTREENDKEKAHQRRNAGLTSQSPSDEAANLDDKLEISKRRLQQGYLAHERSRRITKYIADVGDIPKNKSTNRSSRWRNSNKSGRQ